MIRSVMQGMPQVAPGSSVVVTSTVRISTSGNASGVLQPSGPIDVMQPRHEPQQVIPVAPPTPRHERLWHSPRARP